MDPKTFFAAGVRTADAAVQQVRDGALSNATPCPDWDLAELLRHMVYELAWVPDLLAGKTTDEVGDTYEGDLLGKAPVNNWTIHSRAALQAAEAVDPLAPVHLSYGDVTAEHYLYECGTDILVHGWDVARSLGVPYEVDAAVAQAAYDRMQPRSKEIRDSGLFGAQVAVADDAPVWHKMLALYGRKPV